MSKKKRLLLMLLGGGLSQSDIAAVVHCSKRDVAAASKLIKENNFNVAVVQAMTDSEAEDLFSPERKSRQKNPDYLQPDMDNLVKRKAKGRKLPVKLMLIITSKSVHRSKFHRHPLRGYRYIITLYRYTTTY